MPELAIIQESTERWQAEGMDQMPMMVCVATGAVKRGLDKRSEMLNFGRCQSTSGNQPR